MRSWVEQDAWCIAVGGADVAAYSEDGNEGERLGWAIRAVAGDNKHQAYYRMFADRQMPDAFERTMPEVFTEDHPGAFTYQPRIKRWGSDSGRGATSRGR